MKGILFCFLLLLSTLNTFSQKEKADSQIEKANKAFDSVFYHIAVQVSSSNPSKAMHMADSLYTYSASEKQRLKSLMLKADILEKQEKRGEAILLAQKALNIAEQEKDYSFQARIYGFLSSQYRTIGFLDKGKESIKKGIAISSNIENKIQVTKYRAMADQEMADYAMDEKNYEAAIDYVQSALLAYQQEENERFKFFQIANCYELLGRINIGLNNKEVALNNFSKANVDINKAGAGNTLWAGLIYKGYADAFIENQNLDSAQVYLEKALIIAENGNNGSLKQNVYDSYAKYYKQRNELDSLSKYNSKFNTILKENNAKHKAMINSAYNTLNEHPEDNSKNKTLIYIGIASGLLLLTVIIVSLNEKKRFTKPKLTEIATKKADLILPQKTEEDILQKLNQFENSKAFLNKEMSLSVLIGTLHTNIKYLRQVLKEHKKKDYNNYINELRINYIVDKLKTDPEYLNYKISYLADETGFSSHSKFSAEFREIVGSSPSEFIENLKKIS